MNGGMSPSAISFGPGSFDPTRGVLRGNGADLRLGQRAAALLQALLEADGQPVTKSALMDAAWPGITVEEGNLTVQIAALRKALGTRADGQDWIVTVPRLGYRLFRGDADAQQIETAQPIIPIIAVLPFVNLSGDPEQEYFADGVVEDIITALSRFRSFAVTARNSSFVYKGRAVDVRQVAQELQVRYVLLGSVQRAGGTLRISAQLVDGTSASHIWAEHFDGMIEHVFDFQDRITASVTTLVEPQIQTAEIERSRRERPGSIAAYDLYLRALPKLSHESAANNAEAYALLTEALAREPDNPVNLAYAAYALGQRITAVWPTIGPGDTQKCVELARRGLERAEGDATVVAHCAMVLLHNSKDYEWGMAAIQSAPDANPNNLLVLECVFL